MNSLRISGYDKKYRYELLKGIIEKHQKMKQTYCQGIGLDSEQGLKFWLKKLKKLANSQIPGF